MVPKVGEHVHIFGCQGEIVSVDEIGGTCGVRNLCSGVIYPIAWANFHRIAPTPVCSGEVSLDVSGPPVASSECVIPGADLLYDRATSDLEQKIAQLERLGYRVTLVAPGESDQDRANRLVSGLSAVIAGLPGYDPCGAIRLVEQTRLEEELARQFSEVRIEATSAEQERCLDLIYRTSDRYGELETLKFIEEVAGRIKPREDKPCP